MCANFQKKNIKRAKYLKVWEKMHRIWKYFEKGYQFSQTISSKLQMHIQNPVKHLRWSVEPIKC